MAHLQGQPRLAAAGRPHQGHQPDAINHAHQLARVPLTAYQPSQPSDTQRPGPRHAGSL
jgi:hypothetical protein